MRGLRSLVCSAPLAHRLRPRRRRRSRPPPRARPPADSSCSHRHRLLAGTPPILPTPPAVRESASESEPLRRAAQRRARRAPSYRAVCRKEPPTPSVTAQRASEPSAAVTRATTAAVAGLGPAMRGGARLALWAPGLASLASSRVSKAPRISPAPAALPPPGTAVPAYPPDFAAAKRAAWPGAASPSPRGRGRGGQTSRPARSCGSVGALREGGPAWRTRR